jgi:hypothetical protein
MKRDLVPEHRLFFNKSVFDLASGNENVKTKDDDKI